jgi:hypothetical protein
MGKASDESGAVAYLKSRGFHAFERDWAMGETIGVAAGPIEPLTAVERRRGMSRQSTGTKYKLNLICRLYKAYLLFCKYKPGLLYCWAWTLYGYRALHSFPYI